MHPLPHRQEASRRQWRRQLIAIAAVALIAFALLPRGASAQTAPALEGDVPVPGAAGLLAGSAGARIEAVTAALNAQACYPSHFWVYSGGRWAVRLQDAPDWVNASFPRTLTEQAPIFVRCASEVDVTVTNGPVTLAGTLTLPPSAPPYPATVLISGSGPQDRDGRIEVVPGYEPFRWLAEHLQQDGIAVFRYDDRGVGQSTGQQLTATTADSAADAAAALAAIQARPEIDAERVGVTGHSEGGIAAAMIAARNPEVAFVVSLAGTAIPGGELLELQSRLLIESLGLPPEVAEQQLAQGTQLRELIVAEDWEGLEALLREIGEQQLAALPPEVRETIDFDKLIAEQMLSYQTWMRFFILHDPAEDWRQVAAPVLAIFGGLDLQVPAEENRVPMEAALAQAGNADVTVELFPQANHLFQSAVTGSLGEYATLPQEFVPGLLDTISEWLRTRFVEVAP